MNELKAMRSPLFSRTAAYLSTELVLEIEGVCIRHGGISSLNEIRLRSKGRSSLVVSGRNVMLKSKISADELYSIFKRLCDMAVFAHKDDVCRGFISCEGGMRVGVVGTARYDSDKIVGISDVSTLAFRFPSSECYFAPEVYREWQMRGGGGILVCSPSGGGKTTFIRAMAREVGRRGEKRVVVIDERCEFDHTAYCDCAVDILRGYKRAKGIDIAIRTLSAEVIIADEIGTPEDAEALIEALGTGAEVIATAHGRDVTDASRRKYIRQLIEYGIFDKGVSIMRQRDRFTYRLTELGEIKEKAHTDTEVIV